jgi:hypothetical protein
VEIKSVDVRCGISRSCSAAVVYEALSTLPLSFMLIMMCIKQEVQVSRPPGKWNINL